MAEEDGDAIADNLFGVFDQNVKAHPGFFAHVDNEELPNPSILVTGAEWLRYAEEKGWSTKAQLDGNGYWTAKLSRVDAMLLAYQAEAIKAAADAGRGKRVRRAKGSPKSARRQLRRAAKVWELSVPCSLST